MLSQNMDLSPDRRTIGSRGSQSRAAYTVKSGNMSRNLSTTSVGKVSKKLKDKESLFNLSKTKTEMCIQTDAESFVKTSKGNANKTVKIESDAGSLVDPDAYKEDWVTSLLYKKAMKSEAIKRGQHVDSDFEVDDDEERVAMTVTGYDGNTTIGGLERDPNATMELEFSNTQDPDGDNAIGFMKKYTT